MLYRISVFDESIMPVLYRRPFTGITELDPSLIATLSSIVKAQTKLVTEFETYSVMSVDKFYLVVSHDGDDVGVDQVASGLKEYVQRVEKPETEEMLKHMRTKLKPSEREIIPALETFEAVKLRGKIVRIKPTIEASEDEMRKLFLAGKLDEVIKRVPRTPVAAAIYVKSAIFLETFPAKYPRADEEFVLSALKLIGDRIISKYLWAVWEHVRHPIRLRREHIETYVKNAKYFKSLIESDPIRGPILLYPVGDPSLYEIIMNTTTGYRNVIARTYYGFRRLPKLRSVQEFLSLKPRGEGMERLASLSEVALARDLMRYVATEEDAEDIIAEAPLVTKRFKELVDLLKKEFPVPVSVFAYALSRFSSHIYRLSALMMMYNRVSKVAFAGLRKSIDAAMEYVARSALEGVLRSYNLALITSSLLEAMYAITKARGEEFDPHKVKHLKLASGVAASTISPETIKMLVESDSRNAFIYSLRFAIAISKIYSAFGKDEEILKGLKNALERSMLSTYVEELPLTIVDILDGLSSIYSLIKPSPYTVREIIGYARRMPVYGLILKVVFRRMKHRFEEFEYKDLVEIVESEAPVRNLQLFIYEFSYDRET